MAFGSYLKLGEIKGESVHKEHKEWIEIESVTFGVDLPVMPGGQVEGDADVQEIVLTKRLDKSTPKLYGACCKGEHFPTAVIDLCHATGDQLSFMMIELAKVKVSLVQTSGEVGGFPTETVNLAFNEISWTYTETDDTGAAKGTIVADHKIKEGVTK